MIVLDTNVIVSGLVWADSVPAQVLALSRQTPAWAAAPDTVFEECRRILMDKFGESESMAVNAIDGLDIDFLDGSVYGRHLDKALAAIADSTDAPVVATALAADAPVVSGDRAFHPLREPVVETFTPRGFLDSLR